MTLCAITVCILTACHDALVVNEMVLEKTSLNMFMTCRTLDGQGHVLHKPVILLLATLILKQLFLLVIDMLTYTDAFANLIVLSQMVTKG